MPETFGYIGGFEPAPGLLKYTNFGVTEDEWEFYEHTVEIPASEWGALYAYQNYTGDTPNNEYLLCYEDIIIRLRPDHTIEMTSQAKSNIGKVLGNVVLCN